MATTVTIKVLETILIRPMDPDKSDLVQGLWPRIHRLTIKEDEATKKTWWMASGPGRGLPEEEWQQHIADKKVIKIS